MQQREYAGKCTRTIMRHARILTLTLLAGSTRVTYSKSSSLTSPCTLKKMAFGIEGRLCLVRDVNSSSEVVGGSIPRPTF